MDVQMLEALDTNAMTFAMETVRAVGMVKFLMEALHASWASPGYEDLSEEEARQLSIDALALVPADLSMRQIGTFDPSIPLPFPPATNLQSILLPPDLKAALDNAKIETVDQLAHTSDAELTTRAHVAVRHLRILRRVAPAIP